jgi:pullulanase/glycogen debranching enzyme
MTRSDCALVAGWACEPGRPWPLGATHQLWGGHLGVNFAVYSCHAERVEVCLYDVTGRHETERFALPMHTDGVWHGFTAGVEIGRLYGLRAYGPYEAHNGHRFNPAKLLIDPYARCLVGDARALARELDYLPGLAPDPSDNAQRIPKACVLDLASEYAAGEAISACPRVPWGRTVLYEAHVKGLTRCHPDVPIALRGTYAGVACPPMLAHYQRLGVTTLCLLPVQQHFSEVHLLDQGLSNYWGYNTLGFFIPEPTYATTGSRDVRAEFRDMVDQLHRQGIEVVLDIVFNHTAESDSAGPTVSWRGLDNASWYVLDAQGHYVNHSGCGNSLNLSHPCGIQFAMDCLRWWVQAFGVDGFRFDLATSLGRDADMQQRFHPGAGLLAAIGQDPVLANVKWIAESWDHGPDGYQLGRFPIPWREWNDRFRDAARGFWLGHGCARGELARRLTGSRDLFAQQGRNAMSSVNYITAHDGLNLADLTAFAPQWQSATQRALLATLLCAQGVVQLLAGDEFGHSQGGHSNAYCFDNDITWLNWPAADQTLIRFAAQMAHLRHDHVALRHAQWFSGKADITWRNADGSEPTVAQWEDPLQQCLSCLIKVGDGDAEPAERWLLAFHAGQQHQPLVLPPGQWLMVLDSAFAVVRPQAHWAQLSPIVETVLLAPRTVVALVQRVDGASQDGGLLSCVL